MSGFPLWLIFTEKNYCPVRKKSIFSGNQDTGWQQLSLTSTIQVAPQS